MLTQLGANVLMVGLVGAAVWGVDAYPYPTLGAAFLAGVLAALSAVYGVQIVPLKNGWSARQGPRMTPSSTPHPGEG